MFGVEGLLFMLYRVGIPTTQRTLRKTKGVHGFVVQDQVLADILLLTNGYIARRYGWN
jgi:hypothetical protein